MSARRGSTDREQILHGLLSAALSGDKKAYGQFLNGVAGLARSYISSKIRDTSDAEDVVQNALISIHKALHTYDPSRPCLPWVMAIVHYRLSDWLRSEYSRNKGQHIPIEDFIEAPVTTSQSDYEHVNKAVQGLSSSQRKVIEAMYVRDQSVKEASVALGMSIAAVKVTAHRAYRALKRKLEGES